MLARRVLFGAIILVAHGSVATADEAWVEQSGIRTTGSVAVHDQSEAKATESVAASNSVRIGRVITGLAAMNLPDTKALDELMARAEAGAFKKPQCADARREATALAFEALVASPARRRELVERIATEAAQCTRPVTVY